MKKSYNIKIEITAVFGSDFQFELADKTIHAMLDAWKHSLWNSHMDNKISIAEDILQKDDCWLP